MQRAKWLKIEVDCTHKALVAAIRAAQFNEKIGHGFDLSFRDERRIQAKFSEKITSIEIITDPFGVSTSVETTRYSSMNFQLISFSTENAASSYLMEVNSPPRTLRTLISALADIANNLSVSEVQLPLLEIFGLLRKTSTMARLTRVKASQLKLTPDSTARIDVISGKNAASDLRRFFGESTMSVDKVRIEHPFGPATHAIELSRNGLISIDDTHQDIASDFILNLLIDSYASKSVG
ncbi:hypothetical protein [Burkholderia vietnamiensis]|uniref:hypothetical protein n=1 Tax=Burkholderia vietnamiensis TaxID=60552 RepID=UPI000AE20A0B|nr:hypothetical protein [Burkholderia vietnamiensis]